ncbi:hypothetical protein ACIO3O_41810 [Streptomyces sp. NPDC087440]|uniref:hypothetical protein n=1 Tax=Streptomyces sp. NPDC087440 TaxID=3365790 RepID=UPI0037FBDD35
METPRPFTLAQVHGCLRVLGIPMSENVTVPRTAGLGLLLYCVESALQDDADRLEAEEARDAYLLGIQLSLAHVLHEDDVDAGIALVWATLLHARLDRLADDYTATRETDPDTTGADGAADVPALVHLLAAARAALAMTAALPEPEDVQADPAALNSTRDALLTARRETRQAAEQIERAAAALRVLGVDTG